jgi:hypothetical protein
MSSSTGTNGTPLMALVDAALSDSESSSPSRSNSPVRDATTSSKKDELNKDTPMEKLSFAEQLMTILDDESSPYLRWMSDGKSFTIMNPKMFTSDELPNLFNIRNMSSFVRKLSRWGFNRYHQKETMNSDLFRHKDFRRGERKKCSKIKCTGRHPITSILRKDSSSGKSIRPPQNIKVHTGAFPTAKIDHEQNFFSRSLPPMFEQSNNSAQSVSSVLADAALKSFLLERSVDPATRAKLLALQLMQDASQQAALQEQISQQALLQSLITTQPVDLNHRLAIAAYFGHFPAAL